MVRLSRKRKAETIIISDSEDEKITTSRSTKVQYERQTCLVHGLVQGLDQFERDDTDSSQAEPKRQPLRLSQSSGLDASAKTRKPAPCPVHPATAADSECLLPHLADCFVPVTWPCADNVLQDQLHSYKDAPHHAAQSLLYPKKRSNRLAHGCRQIMNHPCFSCQVLLTLGPLAINFSAARYPVNYVRMTRAAEKLCARRCSRLRQELCGHCIGCRAWFANTDMGSTHSNAVA